MTSANARTYSNLDRALDDERVHSMADEGGAASAAVETQELPRRKLSFQPTWPKFFLATLAIVGASFGFRRLFTGKFLPE